MTERTARLDELLAQEISRILAREIQDPRIGFVTVTRVEVTPDLRHARVWVSIIGQPAERKEAFRALGRAMPFVRHELGVLRLRRIPELHLLLDDSIERGTRVMQIIDGLEEGREPEAGMAGESLPTPRPLPETAEETAEAEGFGAAAREAEALAEAERAARPRIERKPGDASRGRGRAGAGPGSRAANRRQGSR